MNSFANDYFAYLCGGKNFRDMTRNTENRYRTIEQEDCRMNSLLFGYDSYKAGALFLIRRSLQTSGDCAERSNVYFQFLNFNDMLRKHIFIGFFLTLSFNAFPNFDIEEFFSLDREMRGVKKITEQLRNKAKIVSFFDKEGFLLLITHYHNNKMEVDYRYEYFVSDTLLEIREKEFRYLNSTPEEGYRFYGIVNSI
jgi:hypothetical protein